MNKLDRDTRAKILTLLCEGMSIRAITRVTGAGKNTVARLLVDAGISDYTLMKLRQRHGDINFAHYRHMPSILLNGSLARGRTPNVLMLCWAGSVDGERVAFLVALKATKKNEVFVATFHRSHLGEARRFLRGAKRDGRLIREQKDAGHYLKPGTDHLKHKK